MQPGLSEVAGDVESDPGAVLDDQGGDSIDDLLAGAADPQPDDDEAVAGLFEGGLATPERSRRSEPAAEPVGEQPADEPAAPSEIMAELERAIDDDPGAPEPEYDDAALADDVDDAEVADALAEADDALADLSEVHDGDLPDEFVPE